MQRAQPNLMYGILQMGANVLKATKAIQEASLKLKPSSMFAQRRCAKGGIGELVP